MSIELTKLPSGLRIVTDHMPGLETAAIAVHVGVGSRHENEREHGLSHLLEHMAFKGTRRRSARAIAEEIESAGGDLNAATSTEQTAYYARVLAEDTDLALDILADILIDSTFDRDELEREKSVILQEIGSIEDTPDDLVFDMFGETAYANQPIGRRIIGTAKRVASFDPPSIHSYLKRHYGAETIIVSAAGAVDHAKIVEQAVARFEHLPFAAHPQTPPMSSPMSSAAACPRGCSRKCARSAASPTRSTRSTGLIPTPASSASMPRAADASLPNWWRSVWIAWRKRRKTSTRRSSRVPRRR
jgi:predicted Zn-dependent peptidase